MVVAWDRHDVGRGLVVPFAAAAVGVTLKAIANSLPYWNFGSESINDSVLYRPGPWMTDSRVAPLLLAGMAVVLLIFHSARGVAAGVLFAAGLGGYLMDLPALTQFATLDYLSRDETGSGIGHILSIIAGIVILISGMLAASSAVIIRRSPRWLTVLRRVGVVAIACLLGAALTLFFFPFVTQDEWGEWRALIFPLGLTVCGAAVALGLRDRTLQFGGGILLATGWLLSTYYLPYSHFFALFDSSDRARPLMSATIGFVGGLIFVGMGIAAIMRKGRLEPTQSQPNVELNRPSVDSADPQPQAAANTAMTRYLCAAAHLDPAFAKAAVRQVMDDKNRALAPSFGVDVKLVLRHCLAAYRRHRVRDVSLTLLGVPTLLLLIGVLFGGVSAVDFGFILLLLLAGLGVVTTEGWISRYRIAARTLSRQVFDPQRLPRLPEAEEQEISTLEIESSNVTIYGSYRPFVGSGNEEGGWSFALSVLKGKRGFGDGHRLSPKQIELEGLYDAVRRNVEALELDGVVFEDRLYVDGQGIRHDDRFVLPGQARLRSRIDEDQLQKFVHTPEPANRVYRCIRIHGWDGEFVLSMYLNFARTGRGLFAQARYFLLLPLKDDYLAVDRLDPRAKTTTTLTAATLTAMRSKPVRLLLASPFRFFRDLGPTIRRWRSPNAAADPAVNYGATTSIRELAQAAAYRRYFQQLDRDMLGKIVERQVLDSIVEFLDERNIDTSELEERQTAILNNGLIVSGGTVQADSIAVGSEARSIVSQITSRITGGDKAPRKGADAK